MAIDVRMGFDMGHSLLRRLLAFSIALGWSEHRAAIIIAFDIVSEINAPELHNAVVQAQHEIAVRFDFKGDRAAIDHNKKENTLTLLADHKGQLETVIQILKEKMAKRGVAVSALGSRQDRGGDSRLGPREADVSRRGRVRRRQEVVKQIKGLGLKVQAQDHGQEGSCDGQKARRTAVSDRLPERAWSRLSAPVQQLHLTLSIPTDPPPVRVSSRPVRGARRRGRPMKRASRPSNPESDRFDQAHRDLHGTWRSTRWGS